MRESVRHPHTSKARGSFLHYPSGFGSIAKPFRARPVVAVRKSRCPVAGALAALASELAEWKPTWWRAAFDVPMALLRVFVKGSWTLIPSPFASTRLSFRRASRLPKKLVFDLLASSRSISSTTQPDYPRLDSICSDMGLWLIADGAQSFGASVGDRRVGKLAIMTTTSFFPAKPLGCYVDGGAIFTSDAELATKIRSIHQHGKGENRYDHVSRGINSRLDTIQAAILIEKLDIFPDELERRQRVAARYEHFLQGIVHTPRQPAPESGLHHAWATYTIRLKNRVALQKHLRELGIESTVHYPLPVHKLEPYQDCPTMEGGCPISEQATSDVLSIPFHPYLDENTQWEICSAVRQFVAGKLPGQQIDSPLLN